MFQCLKFICSSMSTLLNLRLQIQKLYLRNNRHNSVAVTLDELATGHVILLFSHLSRSQLRNF